MGRLRILAASIVVPVRAYPKACLLAAAFYLGCAFGAAGLLLAGWGLL